MLDIRHPGAVPDDTENALDATALQACPPPVDACRCPLVSRSKLTSVKNARLGFQERPLGFRAHG